MIHFYLIYFNNHNDNQEMIAYVRGVLDGETPEDAAEALIDFLQEATVRAGVAVNTFI